MSDLTVYAEALISTVARAFYDDESIVLIDVLIRDKFLRDDDMAPRLNMPAKKLRSNLQFLIEENLVSSETVDDLAQGGSQATKFYYLDYNRAVHSIRLRIHLLRKQLEKAELRARSSSFYLCPGYNAKRCNGRYTEQEAQQVLDMSTGLFLCRECSRAYQNDPNQPPIDTYTLQLVDNAKELKLAMDNLRRLTVQLSSKYIGNTQLRVGIFDLLQKVRQKGKIVTSNLPSENFSLGIGSKRLAGTGRTAGIKIKKLEQMGIAHNAAQARNYLVGAGARGGTPGQSGVDEDLMFLKNAMGQEVQFTVDRGGGARAQLLATKRGTSRQGGGGCHRARRKLMDAAASRVGASLPLYIRVEENRKRKQAEQEEKEKNENKNKKGGNNNNNNKKNKKLTGGDTFDFLRDNIGRGVSDDSNDTPSMGGGDDDLDSDNGGGHDNNNNNDEDDNNDSPTMLVLADDTNELRQLTEETRRQAFQTQYKLEMNRQSQILKLMDNNTTTAQQQQQQGGGGSGSSGGSPAMMMRRISVGGGGSGGGTVISAEDEDERSVMWEDGE